MREYLVVATFPDNPKPYVARVTAPHEGAAEDEIRCYLAATCRTARPDSPVVTVLFYSTLPAFNVPRPQ